MTSAHLNSKTALPRNGVEANFTQRRGNITQIAPIWIKIPPCYQHLVGLFLQAILPYTAVMLYFLDFTVSYSQHSTKLFPFSISDHFLCKVKKFLFPVDRLGEFSFAGILFHTRAHSVFHFCVYQEERQVNQLYLTFYHFIFIINSTK